MKNKTIILAALAVLAIGFLLCGCTTQREAVRYMDSHGFEAAQYCASAFPVRDSTVYLPGETKVVSHTDTIPGDSIPCPIEKGTPNQGTPVYVHCPPSIHSIDTIVRTDTTLIIRENTAKISVLTQNLAITQDKLQSAEKGRGNWRKWCLVTWIVIVVLGGGYFFLKSRTALFNSIISKIK